MNAIAIPVHSLPILTIDTVLNRSPCWSDSRARLTALNSQYRRTEWTALEVLSLDEISADDRLWVCLHDSALPNAVLRRFAVEVAADAMRRTKWTDSRSWAALDAALAYERGDISYAARAAAWDAASDAARAAAWDAASDAARDAASDAASDAAIRLLRQITLRWINGEDMLAGGVWKA